MVHGGDIYRNQVTVDFSVNTNPFGMPEGIKAALRRSVEAGCRYPDLRAQELTNVLADQLSVAPEELVMGNGASELIMAVIHALTPKKVLLPVPSFFGYERAAAAVGCEIVYYYLREEQAFSFTEDFLACLTEEIDLLFLANPNNPTGVLMQPGFIEAVLRECHKKKICVVLDECFLPLTAWVESHTFLRKTGQFPNLVVLRAFTKTYAMAGVRLGYLACKRELAEKIRRQLPEWNVSVFAQAAGIAALCEKEHLRRAVAFLQSERQELSTKLKKQGMTVYDSAANFLLFKSRKPLYEGLLEQGILIRDCSNFKGLKAGYYRVAVKTREENNLLLSALHHLATSRKPQIDYLLPPNLEVSEKPREDKLHLSELEVPKKPQEDKVLLSEFEVSEKPQEDKAQPYDLAVTEKPQIEYVLPSQIEERSFAMIEDELIKRGVVLPKCQEKVTKRVIHTSADFSYVDTMTYSKRAVETAKELIVQGADLVTDTNMALSGINKARLAHFGGKAHCFMAQEETARMAKERGSTRAAVSMELAASMKGPVIFVVGNAPTALLALHKLWREKKYRPAFIIGVPVGFVNVEAAKELIIQTDIPHIVNRGRKGGSNIAAAIVNAILYDME